jgi:hypothetical protein
MLIKVLYLFQTRLIIYPSIACRFDDPAVWETAFRIPIHKMYLPLNHQKWRDTPTSAIDTNNRCSPLSIARLNSFASVTSISAYNDHSWAD